MKINKDSWLLDKTTDGFAVVIDDEIEIFLITKSFNDFMVGLEFLSKLDFANVVLPSEYECDGHSISDAPEWLNKIWRDDESNVWIQFVSPTYGSYPSDFCTVYFKGTQDNIKDLHISLFNQVVR